MEIWDGYNADRSLAGVDIIRGDEPPEALYHWATQTIVLHTDGTYLIMQRDLNKEYGAGQWEIGAGGSVLKGETPYEGAIRELYEETGIKADKLIPLQITSENYNKISGYNTHYSIYLYITDMEKSLVTLQEGETVDFSWVGAEEILKRKCVPRRAVEIIIKIEGRRLIATDRLLLRPLELNDLETVHLYASDREITRYMMSLPNDTIEESKKFIDDAVIEWQKLSPDFYEFAIVLDNCQIGGVCLYLTEDRKQGELGWILNPDFHGKGYAAEAAKAMIELARNLELESVFARCDSRNKASERLMQRLGMTLEYDNGTRYYEKKNEAAGELKYSLKL